MHKIGRFEIKSILGQGSMGVVYWAHDPQLDREVAIKTLLLPDDTSQGHNSRLTQSLMNEARIAARLNHSGIVQIFDVGQQDGQPYMVMEKVEGLPLQSWLEKQGRLDIQSVKRIMQELLEAVGYAHEQGVVHRDLKPANIMVLADGRVRVMDFGIALHKNQSATGKLAGTPRYMSPEQIQGKSLDARSDVFSLGIIFYELLAGRRLFDQTTLSALTQAIVSGPPPSLMAYCNQESRPFCEIVDKALAKNPNDRYPNARHMLIAFKKIVETVCMPQVDAEANGQGRQQILDFIWKKIERKGDFPSISSYLSAVTASARSENSSASKLSEIILKDFALTNRILRMVNSPYYRGCGPAITTISRAVVMMGMDTVVDVVSGLSIFEHFANKSGELKHLKAQTMHSLMTALNARKMALLLGYPNPEEAFIGGMLHHLGKLIVAFYFEDEYEDIQQLASQPGMDEDSAAKKIMRLNYSQIGEGVAQRWNMPQMVMDSIHGLEDDFSGPLSSPIAKLQGAVSMGEKLGEAALMQDPAERTKAIKQFSEQFKGQLTRQNLKDIETVIDDSVRNAWDISHRLRVNLKDMGLADMLQQRQENKPESTAAVASYPSRDPSDTYAGHSNIMDDTHPSQLLSDPVDDEDDVDSSIQCDAGMSMDARRHQYVMKAINEVIMALMNPFQVNDILMMVIEGMYRGLALNHVLLTMLSLQRDRVVCRFGLGPGLDEIRKEFSVSLTTEGGLVACCLREKREIKIADIKECSEPLGLSQNALRLLKPKSIMMLPLIVNNQPIGMFYVDRNAQQETITKEDVRDLRTLTNQAVLAIQTSLARR